MAATKRKVDSLSNLIMFGDPSDKKLLAALGILSIRHSQLDYTLRMTIKTIAGLSIEQAVDATNRQGAAELRKRIEKLALQTFREGEALLRLQALLTRAQRVTSARNEAIHNLWALDQDLLPVVRKDDHSWEHAPNAEEVDQLSEEIKKIIIELNRARFEGFIFDALRNKTRRTG